MTILEFNKKLTLILHNMKINKNKFKKVIFISIVGVILSFLTFLNFKAGYLEDISPIFFWVIPILTGVLATIIQKEDRVRAVLPSLATVSFIYSFLLIFIFKLYIFINERIGYTSLINYLKPFRGWSDVMIHVALFGLVFFGGLIGVAIMIINKKLSRRGIQINFNYSFLNSFILGSIFIIMANAYYVFASVPPDGRWRIQFPLTSFFVLLYLILFFFASRKLLKNPKYNYLLWTYNLLLAFLFLGNCGGIQQFFQDVEFMYAFQYIPMAPYLVILGVGIVVYVLLLSYLENSRKFREVILSRKIIISFVIIFIFFLGVAMPKVMNFDSLQDSAQKNYYAGLENAYARQQAHIFFDNPFERMFILKTVVTDISPDSKRLIINAYTFFNFKYKTIEIKREPEEAMARMLGREFKQKISRIGKDNDTEQVPISIAGLPKEYFDDNLKLSFEYPNNFYIENDSLGPNFDIVVTPFAPNNPDHNNSEGFIYTSLKMKKITKGDEYDKIMDDFRDKSQDKEFYPDYQRGSMEIDGEPAEVIRYNDVFSGGLITDILLDAGDYVLYITYFEDSDYVDEYKQIIDNIVVGVSIVEELAIKFKSTISSIDISFPGESSLWWNDDDGYSILVPGTESIEIAKDDGVGVQNFVQGGFVRELLDVTTRVLSTRGFILDKSNSSVSGADKRLYDYIQAYKNRDELCVVRVNPDYGSLECKDNMLMCNVAEITCGNDLAGSQAKQRPFLEALDLQNKETIVQIRKQIGDYYQISIGHRRTGSGGLAKKEDSGLRLLYMSQEDPFCEIVEKENIPNNVLEGFGINGCWTKEGYRKFSEN